MKMKRSMLRYNMKKELIQALKEKEISKNALIAMVVTYQNPDNEHQTYRPTLHNLTCMALDAEELMR